MCASVGFNVTSRISPFSLPIEKLARAELVSRLRRRLQLLRRQQPNCIARSQNQIPRRTRFVKFVSAAVMTDRRLTRSRFAENRSGRPR